MGWGGGNFLQSPAVRFTEGTSLNVIKDESVFDQNSSIKALQIIVEKKP